MKAISKKTITVKVESTTWELLKSPKERNLNARNVSVSRAEKATVGPHDTVNLEVQDAGGNVVAQATYTGKSFHDGCKQRSKRTYSGELENYYILGY
jgi:hypothetical protein